MQWLSQIGRFFGFRTTGKWFALSAVVGLVSGLAAVLFQLLTQLILATVMSGISGYTPSDPMGEHIWFPSTPGTVSIGWLVLVVSLGGLVSGLLVFLIEPEAEGPGTDHVIDAFHNKGGQIGWRIPLVKMLASSVTIGTGGSGGREGPIAQIGAGVGSFLATRFKLSVRDRRIMMAAGMGAGVGAIFRVPLAGALFASEIFYSESDFETDVLVPGAISSMVAYSVYCLFLPVEARFTKLFGSGLEHVTAGPGQLPMLTLLAIVLVAASYLFSNTLHSTRRLFQRIPGPRALRPFYGAVLTGLLAMAIYNTAGGGSDEAVLAVLSSGYGIIQLVLDQPGALGVGLLAVVALGKMATTSLTIGSGGAGGLFGPSMVIGACVGAATAGLLELAFPGLVQPQVFVVIGMAGFFAGSASAPFSTIIMVWEMTGHQQLLLGTMWVSLLCYMFCRRARLFVNQVPTRLESPAHHGDFIVDILEGIKVGDVALQQHQAEDLIPQSMTLNDIVHHLAQTRESYFPVLNEAGEMIGIFSAGDVRAYLYDETIWSLTIAQDVMVTKVISVTPEDDLHTALQRFTLRNIDELPVVDPENPKQLLGMLRRKEAIAVYNQQLSEAEKSRQADDLPTSGN